MPRFVFGAPRPALPPDVVPYGTAVGVPLTPAAYGSPSADGSLAEDELWRQSMPVLGPAAAGRQEARPPTTGARSVSAPPSGAPPRAVPASGPGVPPWSPAPSAYPGAHPAPDVVALAHELAHSQSDVLVRALLPALDRHRRRDWAPSHSGTPVAYQPR
ncbi:hypothetical protein ACFVUN_06260 [Kitasatospora griseola]|uniref:hypothetical protein n=1 Tax=Kitasatospora griseola TaxID=2064 RepID=UPI0036D7DED0